MNIPLQRFMVNKHTTGAALVYGVVTLIGEISLIWFPDHATQINATLDHIKQFAVIYGFAMAGDSGKKDSPPDNNSNQTKDNTMKTIAIIIGAGILVLSFLPGCQSKLEPGGAYAPVAVTTNADGSTVTNATSAPDIGLYFADAAYKTAYDLVDGVLKLESDNRAQLFALSPQIKHDLDKIRPTVWDIDQRWAAARSAYVKNPTPAGLTGLQLIFAELQKLLPIVEQQTSVITTTLTTPKQ